jgi:hypothetical protein
MNEFIIDTNILENASSSTPEKREKQIQESLDFIRAFVACESLLMVLDEKGKCRDEYDYIMKDDEKLGQKIITELESAGRIKTYPTRPIKVSHRKAFTELCDVHFDSGDYLFVEAAIASTSKRIVTEDKKSYTVKAQRVLRQRLDIRVYRARPATGLIPAEPSIPTEPDGQH